MKKKKPVVIRVRFEGSVEKRPTVEEITRVPIGSSVSWNVILSNNFPLDQPVLSIYFPMDTPFDWKNESTRIYNTNGAMREYKIAEGVAERAGAFKYGIKLIDGQTNEEIYDEDPFLYVY